MKVNRMMMCMMAVVLVGCETREPVLPKPATADDCLLFVFRDPLKLRGKLKLALADDMSVELHDYMYTKVNQSVGDHHISVAKGLKDDLNLASLTYSCMPKQKHYFALKRGDPIEGQKIEDTAVSIVPIHSEEAFNRLQHFRFMPAMVVSKGEKQPSE